MSSRLSRRFSPPEDPPDVAIRYSHANFAIAGTIARHGDHSGAPLDGLPCCEFETSQGRLKAVNTKKQMNNRAFVDVIAPVRYRIPSSLTLAPSYWRFLFVHCSQTLAPSYWRASSSFTARKLSRDPSQTRRPTEYRDVRYPVGRLRSLASSESSRASVLPHAAASRDALALTACRSSTRNNDATTASRHRFAGKRAFGCVLAGFIQWLLANGRDRRGARGGRGGF
jgi:hypothetical protein